MDENCLCQFKVTDTQFWLMVAQIAQGRFQLRASQLAVTGNKDASIILGGTYKFVIKRRGRHFTGDVATEHHILRGQVKGMGGVCPAEYKQS
ncbi:hypothetical protein BOH74_14215 [Pseudomonas versuta]|uniref:Uncharacterized protein n=1 Tax=Pseudomonas versuta TaxID=1788301 RepID=A0A0M3UF26_9PSED|nr:hypothetical protein AOC04_19820 [Pseudomonas versuta]OKA17869.1 hypothetical protein BOH73_21530 [Pseudomonas versuta]OKA22574.1 hypothetical protein BOH74_14215 [Pseudomonas versuta]